MRKWEDFIKTKTYSLFENLVYRELLINCYSVVERENTYNEIEIELDKFINEVEGKKYQFSCCNYVFGCFSKEEDYGKNIVNSECDSFFCSQLVAAAYKKLQIINDGISSDKYMPRTYKILTLGAFTEKEKLNFNSKFDLGNETNILNFMS